MEKYIILWKIKSMRRILLLLILCLQSFAAISQEIYVEKEEEFNPNEKKDKKIKPFRSKQVINNPHHEINLGIGNTVYYGDLNTTNSNSPLKSILDLNLKNMYVSASLGYRYNFKTRFSFGIQASYAHLGGSDGDNDRNASNQSLARFRRNLSFYSDIYEVSGSFYYEPFRTKKLPKIIFFSPYIGVGLGYFAFDPKTMLGDEEIKLHSIGTEGQKTSSGKSNQYSLQQFNLPLTLGAKVYFLNTSFSMGFEAQYRYLFTDYLDDVSTNFTDPLTFRSEMSAEAADLAIRLSDRSSELSGFEDFVNKPGSQRGSPRFNDGFLTMQIKLSYYFR